jgi:hypothetical protein
MVWWLFLGITGKQLGESQTAEGNKNIKPN